MSEPLPVPPRDACLRAEDGRLVPLQFDRWLGSPTSEEDEVLARAVAPVLDVGCGPGRHVLTLGSNGIVALGIDSAPSAVALARRRGAPVLERSVFGPVPGAGRWATVLLLDGNIGIGGDPLALLRRAAELLAPAGAVIAEVEPPGAPTRRFRARVEAGGDAGPWFPWAQVGADGIAPLAARAGLHLAEVWKGGTRWFAAARGSPRSSTRPTG